MPRNRPLRPLALALLTLAGFPALTWAECSLNVIGLTFGNYDPFNASDTDITGSVSVTCDTDTSVQLSLSAGFGPFTARQMKNGSSVLFYNLFTDPSHLSIWGDGSPGTSLVSFSGTSGSQTVYGRVPAGQNVSVGTYGDTITVTLTF
jgi:spore coat protein U-like protein